MKANVSYESTAQLATIKRYAMGCHIQISLNTAKLNTKKAKHAILARGYRPASRFISR